MPSATMSMSPTENVHEPRWKTWLGRMVWLAMVGVVIYCGWVFYASFLPKWLGPGEFPEGFRAALEKALPARLPESTEFGRAVLLHGAGDYSIDISATVAAVDIAELKRQFSEADLKNSDSLAYSGTRLFPPRFVKSEVEFFGAAKWGCCLVMRTAGDTHDVLFHFNSERPMDTEETGPLFECFNRYGTPAGFD